MQIRPSARRQLRFCGPVVVVIIASFGLFEFACSELPPLRIVSQPADQAVYLAQPAVFKANVAGGEPLTFQWQRNGVNIPGATSAIYTTPRVTQADNGAQFRFIVSNPVGTSISNIATLSVNSGIDAPTYDYENMRMGQDVNEKRLTTASVNPSRFGKLGSFMVDGLVDGQPLYLSNVTMPNLGSRNVLYVVTEHGSVFAFDADSANGNTTNYLWMASTLLAAETPSDDRDCTTVTPEIGITSTPVIDRSRGAIYVVAATEDAAGNYHHRLHALDLTTGKELFGGPTTITATYPGSGANSVGGNVIFDPSLYMERAALLEVNGIIYTTWASHCDLGPYTSWVIAYSADTLQQTSALNLVPNGNKGGIWMSGAGPASDASGNIYIALGNGDFDTNLDANAFPANGNCGNCLVKISSGAPLALLDYFTPSDTVSESDTDHDFGSGGPLLLPDVVDANGKTRHLAVSGAKDPNLYVFDRDNLGKFNPSGDSIYQELTGAFAGLVFSKAAYFNGTVYFGGASDTIKAFPVVNGKLATTPASQSPNKFWYPGATPTVSANGTTNGIVWGVDNGPPNGVLGALWAYDATNLGNELYDSNQAANGRDQFSHNKFITPLVANGKVYIGTSNGVAVFGLLP